GVSMLELYDYVFFIFLILAVISVMRYQRIPGKYPILGILIGLSCYVIQDGFTGFMNSMSGIVMGLIISFFLYYLRALSLEDVILFVAMGSFLGFEDLLYTSMYTIFFSLVIGVIMLLIKRMKRMNKIWNQCVEWLNTFIAYDLKSVVLQQKQDAIHFPIIYAILPAVILHYLSLYG